MSKRICGMLILTASLFVLTACGENEIEQDRNENTSDEGIVESQSVQEDKEQVSGEGQGDGKQINTEPQEEEIKEVTIYYGNDMADALISSQIQIAPFNPQNLINELKKCNVVSADTIVNSMQIAEENNEKLIRLDLSMSFQEYLLMMGTSGEYIVMGSLVNTFLSSYDADRIQITVEGEMLESGHAEYGGYLYKYQETLGE